MDNYKLYSFDFFDTLVMRRTAVPCGIFSLIEEELKNNRLFSDFSDLIKENFFKLRVQIQDFLLTYYCSEKNREVLIEQIYDYFLQNGYLKDKHERDLLLNFELDLELKNMIPIQENILKIKDLISRKNRVIIITDTYFSKNFIEKVLQNVAPEISDIKIYASSFYGKTKRHKDIWQIVKTEEKVEYNNWIHVGDNFIADVQIPSSLGITTKLFNKNSCADWENIINSCLDNAFFQLVIGSSKNTLISKQEFSKQYMLGASYVGPLLFPYVNFLVKNAQQNNIENLYFIARDGYILEKMAKLLIKSYGYDIKTHYIYGSRLAWRCGNFKNLHDMDFSCIFDEFWLKNSISRFAERLHITAKEIINLLPQKYKRLNPNQILSSKKIKKIKALLVNSEDFKTICYKANKAQIEIIKKYLYQEIDFKKNFAFVDLQGTGKTQTALANIIKDMSDRKIITYYFYTGKYNNCQVDQKIQAFPNVDCLNFLIECFCRAPHGQTVGYTEKKNKIVPVFDLEEKYINEWNFHDLTQGILDFMKFFLEAKRLNNIKIDSFELFHVYFRYAMGTPSKMFATLVGDIPFSLSEAVSQKEVLAPKITKSTILKYLLGKRHYSNMPHLSKLRSKRIYVRIINLLEKHKIKSFFFKKKKYLSLKEIFIFKINIFKKKVNTFPYGKTFFLFNKKIFQSKLKDDVLNFYLLGIKLFSFNIIFHMIKKRLKKIRIDYDNVYLLQITSMGECYLFCTLFNELRKINASKFPIFLVTKKYYTAIIKMMLPKIPVFYISNSEILTETVSDTYEYRKHKIYIPFTMKYLKNLEKKFISSNGKIHYFDALKDHLNIPSRLNLEYLKPKTDSKVEERLKEKMKSIGLNLNKFVIFSPEAVTCTTYSINFWTNLVNACKENGIDVFLNITDKRNYIENTCSCILSIEEILCLSKYAKRVIGIRSGLLEILSISNIPMDVIYTIFPLQEIQTHVALKSFSIKQLPHVNTEIIYEYNSSNMTTEQLFKIILNNILFDKSEEKIIK